MVRWTYESECLVICCGKAPAVAWNVTHMEPVEFFVGERSVLAYDQQPRPRYVGVWLKSRAKVFRPALLKNLHQLQITQRDVDLGFVAPYVGEGITHMAHSQVIRPGAAGEADAFHEP